MLSLAEVRRAVRCLHDGLRGAHLQRIVQPDERSIVLSFYGQGAETHLLFCCRPKSARIAQLAEAPAAPPSPPAFAQYLRAHLRGASAAGARVLGGDRLAALTLDAPEGRFDLVLSVLGPRSNVYLLDGAGNLAASLRPLAETRGDLALGEAWTNPSSAPPREGEDRWHEAADADYLRRIEEAYGEIEGSNERDELQRRLEVSLDKELRFAERRLAKLASDLESARGATGARHLGELLKGVLHTVPPRATSVTAVDHATGEEVAIPLDAKLSPAQNLDRLFTRYQKAQKAVANLETQLAAAQERRDRFERLRRELADLGEDADVETLRRFAAGTEAKESLARHYRAGKEASAAVAKTSSPAAARRLSGVPSRLHPKIYLTEDGLEIWVGRSDEANDYLTTRLANGNDLFFHVEGAAGSHVILRTGGRKDPPSEAVLDACELAVHYSKQRNAGRAEVHVAPIRDVKKPRGAKPGLVYVTRGKTVHLRRDRGRLDRVLSRGREA